MVEMTQADGIMFGVAIVVPASICLVWMVVDDIRSYRERKQLEKRNKEQSIRRYRNEV